MFTTDELLKKLQSEIENKDHSAGNVTVTLLGIEHQIKGKYAVGHLVQEWLFTWCKQHGFDIIPNPATQKFPDYYIGSTTNQSGQLEVKTYSSSASPAFDVADFHAFVSQLPESIHKLYADFLVCSYELSSHGTLILNSVKVFKIWELTGPSEINHITSQIREKKCKISNKEPLSQENLDSGGRIQKFRPANVKKGCFKNVSVFLDAIQSLIDGHKDATERYPEWRSKVSESHLAKYGKKI